MDWSNIVSLIFSGGILGTFGSMFYFRPKLKAARAQASKAETEAKKERHDYLMERVNSMEELYKKQGDALDEVRQEVINLKKEAMIREQVVNELTAEVATLKEENQALKVENQALSDKVEKMETEVRSYRSVADTKKKK